MEMSSTRGLGGGEGTPGDTSGPEDLDESGFYTTVIVDAPDKST